MSRTFKIIGLGETQVEKLLMDLIQAQSNPTIAPYAKVGDVHVRITAAAPSQAEAEKLLAPLTLEINRRLAPYVYSDTDATLAEVVLNLLQEQNHTLAIAESCTGGLMTSDIVSVPGSSAVFLEGLCTYSNAAKIARLGVPAALIETHGAVSPQVAAAMAEGVAKTSGASVGISTTGVAGPGGGTADKPVGLVYVGVCINGEATTEKFNLTGNRDEVRVRAASHALDALRRRLML